MILFLVIFIFWLCSIVLTIVITEYYPVFHPTGYFSASSEFLELSGLTSYVILFSNSKVVVFASRPDGIILDDTCLCYWKKHWNHWTLEVSGSPNENLFPSEQTVIYDKYANEISIWRDSTCLFRGFANFEMNKLITSP